MTEASVRRKLTAALCALTAVSILLMWLDALWPAAVAYVSVFVLGIAWIAGVFLGGFTVAASTVLAPVILAVLWIVVQLVSGITIYPWRTNLSLIYWLCAAATVFLSLQIFADNRCRARFLQWLVWLGLATSLAGLIQYFLGNDRIFGVFPIQYDPAFVFGPFVYHSQFAAFVELVLPIALYKSLMPGEDRLLGALTAAVLFAGIVTSASRGGFIFATLEIVAAPLLLTVRGLVRGRKAVVYSLVPALLIVALAVAAGPKRLMERFSRGDPVRQQFTLSSLEIFRDHPWTGVGLGNWPVIYPSYARFDDGLYANQAHNDWAQWAAEGGVVFPALMLWVGMWAVPRALKSVWGTGVPVVLIHCLIDYPIQREAVALLFFCLLGALVNGDCWPSGHPVSATSSLARRISSRYNPGLSGG